MASLKMADACAQARCRFAHGGLSSGDADDRGDGTLPLLTQHGVCCAHGWGAPVLWGSPQASPHFPREKAALRL